MSDFIDFLVIPTQFTKAFLQENYIEKRLSIAQIATQFSSARGTILKALRFHEIPSRQVGRNTLPRKGFGLPFGKRLEKHRLVIHKREQEAIDKMIELRSQGFTLTAIAEAFNTMGIPTKTGRAKWSAKTIHQILIREQS